MSGKIKSILSILICLIILSGCQNKMIPAGYLPKPKEISRSITGSWIKVATYLDTLKDNKIDLYGELLAFQNDTLYVLTEGGFISLQKNKINSVSLYIFAPTEWAFLGLLFIVPNVIGALSYSDYAQYFLEIGIPIFLVSTIMGAVDSDGANNIMHYPGIYTLEDFTKFARFPQGLPPGLERNKLHLVITEAK
ncbi:MAG: hypothetical protein ABSA76_07440 [Bacteroidales bacterium]